MPELPEVEIIKQSLQKTVLYKKIKNVLIKNRNLRFKIENNIEKFLKNKKIINISRKSKYLIIHLNNENYLIIHFGMSGTLHLIKKKNNYQTNLSFYSLINIPKKHNHVEINIDNFKLVYNDPRKFGFLKFLFSKNELKRFFINLGPEPLEPIFNFNYLKKILLNKERNIKNILLDQKLISGVGNIYANEILFCCKINPFKKGKNINEKEIKKIIKYSRIILKKAIKKGGSTIRNFKNTKGDVGLFQNEFKVYDKTGKKCLTKNCGGKILRFFISNRSTYLCKYCQK